MTTTAAAPQSLDCVTAMEAGEAASTASRKSASMRVASYNVLAQCLAKSSYFTFAEKATLKWANRSKALAALVPSLGDVICLSEVDYVPHWRATLEPEYVLLHHMRGSKQYGQAIAYRRAQFRLIDTAACNFDDVADATSGPGADLHRRSCVAVFAALQPIPPVGSDATSVAQTPPLVIIASTHLFFGIQHSHPFVRRRRVCCSSASLILQAERSLGRSSAALDQ